ncbi:MAG: putative endonuclease [Paracoccaceae bacterium]|jgi:putative endonuclease
MTREGRGDERAARRAREHLGRRAETRAAIALRLKGYRLLDRRIRTPAGEIDLVMRKGAVVVFVEVKARQSRAQAAEAISLTQRRRIVRAAAHYIAANPRLGALTQRFDAVLVEPRKWPHHVINAWSESGD